MRIEQLEILVNVAETGSITHSAELLHRSQQGMSHAIISLEKELGGILFERNFNKISLTPEGEKTLEKAKEILRIYDEILFVFNNQKQIEEKELNLYITPLLSRVVLKKAISIFNKRHPKVTLKVIELQPLEIIEKIRNNKNFIGLLSLRKYYYEEWIRKQTDIKFEVFCECQMYASVAKTSPLASKKSILPQEIIKYPFVLFNSEQHIDFVHKMFKTLGLGEPNIRIKTSDLELYQNAIDSGQAVGMTSFQVSKKNASFVNIPLELSSDLNLIIGCVTSTDQSNSVNATDFIKIARYLSKKVK